MLNDANVADDLFVSGNGKYWGMLLTELTCNGSSNDYGIKLGLDCIGAAYKMDRFNLRDQTTI